MNTAQLELSLESNRTETLRRHVQPARQRRAIWWFQRMRQIVDRAMDWHPTPPPRPQQIWFSDRQRQNLTGFPSPIALGDIPNRKAPRTDKVQLVSGSEEQQLSE